MTNLIEPRTLKGFRDYPPELMIPREHLLEKTRQVYRSYGFVPIDTPALEYTEILLGKIEDESEMRKIIYRFQDHGGRDVALRFDLTVPFARFAAQHSARADIHFTLESRPRVLPGSPPSGESSSDASSDALSPPSRCAASV